MKQNVYNWIIRVQKKDGSVEYSVVMEYSFSLMRILLKNLRFEENVYTAHAFKKIDTL